MQLKYLQWNQSTPHHRHQQIPKTGGSNYSLRKKVGTHCVCAQPSDRENRSKN